MHVADGFTVRVGCDLVEPSEIAESVRQFGDRYISRVFTDGESAACVGSDRILRLAARFAAKEAVIKLFAEPDLAYPLTEIEVVSTDGVPTVRLRGSLAERAGLKGWGDVSVSLSHCGCHAMAVVTVTASGWSGPAGVAQ